MTILSIALLIALVVAIVCDIVRISQYCNAKYKFTKNLENKLKARNALLEKELVLVIKEYLTSTYGSASSEIRAFVEEYFRKYKQ